MSRADWSEAPEWANWWAVDEDGEAFWYENKPSVYDLMWGQLSEGYHTYSGVVDPTHWRESLERRPEEEANLVWCECGDGYEEDSDSALFIENMGKCENCAAADGEAELDADNINHPAHYQSDAGVECIDAIHAALGDDGFVAHCRGTAMKYVFLAGKKCSAAEDLRKAAWYLERAARVVDNNEGE